MGIRNLIALIVATIFLTGCSGKKLLTLKSDYTLKKNEGVLIAKVDNIRKVMSASEFKEGKEDGDVSHPSTTKIFIKNLKDGELTTLYIDEKDLGKSKAYVLPSGSYYIDSIGYDTPLGSYISKNIGKEKGNSFTIKYNTVSFLDVDLLGKRIGGFLGLIMFTEGFSKVRMTDKGSDESLKLYNKDFKGKESHRGMNEYKLEYKRSIHLAQLTLEYANGKEEYVAYYPCTPDYRYDLDENGHKTAKFLEFKSVKGYEAFSNYLIDNDKTFLPLEKFEKFKNMEE